MKRAVLLLLLLASRTPDAAPACAVSAQPRVALAPVRWVRVQVTIEARDGGALALLGEDGPETSSLIQRGARTTWVEWKNVELTPGEYEVRLSTASGCNARDVMTVAGR